MKKTKKSEGFEFHFTIMMGFKMNKINKIKEGIDQKK
jgi:hypothetical protein